MASTDDSGARNYRGASGAERRERRRTDLINAGVEVFGSVGFRAASVDQVCATAGLTKRYFYESFADREELFIASYRASSDLLLAVLEHAATPSDIASTPNERIDNIISTLFEVCRDNPRMARILLLEALGVSDAVDNAHRASTDRYIALMVRVAGEAVPLDAIDEQQQYLLGASAIGAALHLLREWILRGYNPSAEENIAALQFTIQALLDRARATSTGRTSN